MKPEQLEKGVSLNNQIRNLQRKLKVVQAALDKDNWDESYIEIVIGDEVEGTVRGKDVFDFLHGYLSLNLKAAQAAFDLL